MLYTDLDTKNLIGDKGYIIQNAEIIDEEAFEALNIGPVDISELEKLYETYKHSVPSEDNKHNIRKEPYFKALDLNELSQTDLETNTDRNTAGDILEATLLVSIIFGTFIWTEPAKWFWQSQNDRDFVILRKWVI